MKNSRRNQLVNSYPFFPPILFIIFKFYYFLTYFCYYWCILKILSLYCCLWFKFYVRIGNVFVVSCGCFMHLLLFGKMDGESCSEKCKSLYLYSDCSIHYWKSIKKTFERMKEKVFSSLLFLFSTVCFDSLWSLFQLQFSVGATCPCSGWSQTSEMISHKVKPTGTRDKIMKLTKQWWKCATCPMAWFCRSQPVYTTSRESPFSTAWPSPRLRSWTTTASKETALFAFAKHTWGT